MNRRMTIHPTKGFSPASVNNFPFAILLREYFPLCSKQRKSIMRKKGAHNAQSISRGLCLMQSLITKFVCSINKLLFHAPHAQPILFAHSCGSFGWEITGLSAFLKP
jgi:hypothetical protein